MLSIFFNPVLTNGLFQLNPPSQPASNKKMGITLISVVSSTIKFPVNKKIFEGLMLYKNALWHRQVFNGNSVSP